MTKIYTVGYEGATLADFIHTLETSGVSLLIDVRELPQSRRPGFSKRVLSEALAEAGISYSHVRQLGDPKAGRDAARRGDLDEFRAIFNAHMELAASHQAAADIAQAAKHEVIALMCYERAPQCCHRSIVAEKIKQLASAKIVHLGVQPASNSRGVADGAKADRLVRAR